RDRRGSCAARRRLWRLGRPPPPGSASRPGRRLGGRGDREGGAGARASGAAPTRASGVPERVRWPLAEPRSRFRWSSCPGRHRGGGQVCSARARGGGPTMKSRSTDVYAAPAGPPIPLSRPPVDDELKRAVLAAMDSRQYILGPECRALETELAQASGVTHAVLTSSGTAALWLSLRALGVKPGDEILVPAHTAFPTVEAICLSHARPLFVDADVFYAIDVADAATRVTPRTVGIVPVHLYG